MSMRQIHFPPRLAIGKLYQNNTPLCYRGTNGKRFLGTAMGTVRVPRDACVRLQLRNDKHVLECISSLKTMQPSDLQELEAVSTPFSDADCAVVSRLSGLRKLDLSSTLVTDKGVKELSLLPHLACIHLSHCMLTDASCQMLARCKSLQGFELRSTDLSDEAMSRLSAGKTLRSVEVSGSGFGDKSAAILAKNAELFRLFCSHTKISDAGLARFKKATKLKFLDLSWDNITDASLPVLERMPDLASVNLSNTKVSAAGIASLKKNSPACAVIYQPARTGQI